MAFISAEEAETMLASIAKGTDAETKAVQLAMLQAQLSVAMLHHFETALRVIISSVSPPPPPIE